MRTLKLVHCLLLGSVLLAVAGLREPAVARGGANAKPTDAPAAPTPAPFGTVDGTWEIQLQHGSMTIYSSLFLLGRGEGVDGRWTRDRLPTAVTGGLSGDRFSFSGSDAKGPFTLTGYIENASSMIGLFAQAGKTTPFTATHKGLPSNEVPAKQHRRKHGKEHGKAVEIQAAPGQPAQQPAVQALPQTPQTLPQAPQTQTHP